MRAAVFYGPSNIKVEEVEFKIDKNEIALKVSACAVCGYDARIYRNGHIKVKPPVILGHEICGELLQKIDSYDGILDVGTRVAVSPVIPCLSCQYCSNKQYNLCNNLKEIGSSVNGGFAEYIKIPEKVTRIGGLIKIPNNLSNEEAALLEPLACCLNGFSQFGQIEKKKSVLIIGDGTIGLLHLQLSKKLFGAKTAVLGKIPFRMQMAKSAGADAVFMFDDHAVDNVLNFTNGEGANFIIVATSNPEALTFLKKVVSKNSKINIFAGFSSNQTFPLDFNWLHYNQISIFGSFSSTPDLLRKAARLVSDGKIDLSKIVTHRYSLNDIKHAISITEELRGLRTMINRF